RPGIGLGAAPGSLERTNDPVLASVRPTHDMWQVGISFNCNNPDFCGANLGGFWGWVEFDRSADGQQTWGDAELTGCFHSVGGGGFAGAAHMSIEVTSWTVAGGSAGPQTFFASGVQT